MKKKDTRVVGISNVRKTLYTRGIINFLILLIPTCLFIGSLWQHQLCFFHFVKSNSFLFMIFCTIKKIIANYLHVGSLIIIVFLRLHCVRSSLLIESTDSMIDFVDW